MQNAHFSKWFVLFTLGFTLHICAAEEPATNSASPSKPTPYLTPEEELKTFQLPEGYSMELVVGDPAVIPVVYRPGVSGLSRQLRARLSSWDNALWDLASWYRET